MPELTSQDRKIIEKASKVTSTFIRPKVILIIFYVIALLGFIDYCFGREFIEPVYYLFLMFFALFFHASAHLHEAYVVIKKLTQGRKD